LEIKFLKYFKSALFFSVLAIFVSLTGCVSSATKTTALPPTISEAPTTKITPVKNVIPIQANELIQANKDNTKFVIIDVRTPVEYADGHLQNAVNIDYNSESFKDDVSRLDIMMTYLVYCRTGARSAAATNIMAELGFKDIYNMTGGITEWQAQGLGIVK
jgi:rhodanese-related sulfurtransferase